MYKIKYANSLYNQKLEQKYLEQPYFMYWYPFATVFDIWYIRVIVEITTVLL